MSTAGLLRRVNKLEESAAGGIAAILWAEPSQDAAQVEAQYVAAHPASVGQVLVVGWQEEVAA